MQWLCFKTNNREEFLAKNSLMSAGFKVLMPYYKKTVRHARKQKQVLNPIFPTYGFLLYDGNVSSLYKIKYTRGIKNYLMKIDGFPQIVPEQVIKSIQELQQDDGTYLLDPNRFKPGKAVKIMSGALSGISTIFKEQIDQHRSKLIVNFLGRINLVNINSQMIEHA
jgi:transcriptional antiterminator RfaH